MEKTLEAKLENYGIPHGYQSTSPEAARRTLEVLETLKNCLGYKTVDVREWSYTGGRTGQTARVGKLAELGDKAITAIRKLAETGYQLDTYWDSKGSLGEGDITVIQMLLNEEAMKKYLSILSKAENSSKKFEYQAENVLSMMILSKFNEEESSKVISFLNDCGYFDFFNQKHTSLTRNTLENIMKHDDKKLKKIMEKLRQCLNYKTVNVRTWDYTGGPPGQIARILELSEIENSTDIIEKLAKTGYKLDTYWEPKGAIRREDIQVFDILSKCNFLTREENIDRYVEIVDEIKKTFKQPKMNHNAANALSITKLIGLPKEDTSTIIRFLKYCDCPDFFNGHSELPKDLITPIAFSDMNTVNKVLETLNKKFNYKTVNVKKWDYTGGPQGQIRRILEISDLGGKAVKALEAIAESGYKLNTYWDDRGSIGEDEVRAIRKLVEADSIEKYRQVIKGLRRLGYKVKPDLERMIEITRIPESANALDMLFSQGYKLDEEKIREEDIMMIRKLGEDLFDKRLENINVKIEHKCLYKEDAEEFIKLFSSLKNAKDKKKIIKALLNCSHENKEAIKWLDDNEPGLIREVGVLS